MWMREPAGLNLPRRAEYSLDFDLIEFASTCAAQVFAPSPALRRRTDSRVSDDGAGGGHGQRL